MPTCTRAPTVHRGIDWSRVSLPPCVRRVLANIDAADEETADRMAAALARSYYCPQRVLPDATRADRHLRVAHRQVCAVSSVDGAIIATWRDTTDEYGTSLPFGLGGVSAPLRGDPGDYAALMAALRAGGEEPVLHHWGEHWQVSTPSGRDFFVPADPDSSDDVTADTAVLRLLGALAVQHTAS